MIASPITTLWEGWAVGVAGAGFGGGSYNHAWTGGPLTILSQHIAGIAPDAPGWAAIRIAPHPATLGRFTAVAPTPRGPVRVAWTRRGTGGELVVTTPEGVPTTVEPPPGAQGIDPAALRFAGGTRTFAW
jgi:hypothetical protein